MSKLNVVPFQPEHARQILAHPIYANREVGCHQFLKQHEIGDGFTGIREDGIVVGAAGVTKLWEGVGEAWSYLLPLCKREHKLTLHREVKKGLDRIAFQRRYHRIQLLAEMHHNDAHAWAISLGFEYEGALPYYGPAPEKLSFYRFVKLYL